MFLAGTVALGIVGDFISGWVRIKIFLISCLLALSGRGLRYLIARE
jgi:membrane protein YqaA with SNARE-associated domain